MLGARIRAKGKGAKSKGAKSRGAEEQRRRGEGFSIFYFLFLICY
jgi:hypothetical protein